jgi:hypothetical protein
MSELITKVAIPVPGFTIDHRSKILLTGSCFTENIGTRAEQLKFKVCTNPFGVQYNPQSIANGLNLLLDKEAFYLNDLRCENELWFSYSHYTLFSDPDPDLCLTKINSGFSIARNILLTADILFITLGTSWTYILKETGEVVSNCHKMPAARFDRVFSTTDQSFDAIENAVNRIRQVNPGIKVVISVSPVRHLKDGAIENQRSKSALILTAARLEKELSHVYYFPAYEIFMDELRDYRFYASDMLHPSETAIDYIWERFVQTFFTEETSKTVLEIQHFLNSLGHRPMHISSNSYIKFISSLVEKLVSLTKKYPFIDFSKEQSELNKKKIVSC